MVIINNYYKIIYAIYNKGRLLATKAVLVQYYENAAENTGGVLFLASSGYCDTTTIHNQIGTIPICNIYRILSCSANRNSNSDFLLGIALVASTFPSGNICPDTVEFLGVVANVASIKIEPSSLI